MTAARALLVTAQARRRGNLLTRTPLALAMHFLEAGGLTMLLILAVLLGIAWLLGFTVFHVASGAIHLLIVLAVIAAIVHFVQGGRTHLAPRV